MLVIIFLTVLAVFIGLCLVLIGAILENDLVLIFGVTAITITVGAWLVWLSAIAFGALINVAV